MPSHVAERLAAMLHDAHGSSMNGFAFAPRGAPVGGCARIFATPMPVVFTVKPRRFLAMHPLLLPFGLVGPLGALTPAPVLFVAYPILSLEQIGEKLQNPFADSNLRQLPLDALSDALEVEPVAITDAPRAAHT